MVKNYCLFNNLKNMYIFCHPYDNFVKKEGKNYIENIYNVKESKFDSQ